MREDNLHFIAKNFTICEIFCSSGMNRWRWRDSNPRPKDSTLEYTTSISGFQVSPRLAQPAKSRKGYPLRPESPLSPGSRITRWHSGFVTPNLATGRSSVWVDVTLLEGQLRSSLMQLRALQRMKCGWHLCFVLILRGRYLSARNSGPASSVDACHPHCNPIIP